MGAFTDIFIKRPVLATVVSLLILLVGLQAAFKLPIRQYPEVTKTTITITTSYPGANADQIKGFITTPIQQAVAVDRRHRHDEINLGAERLDDHAEAQARCRWRPRACRRAFEGQRGQGRAAARSERSGGHAHDRHGFRADVYRLQFRRR